MNKIELLEIIKTYTDEEFKKKPFRPGVDAVKVSGIEWTSDDVLSLIDTALGGIYTEHNVSRTFSKLLSEYIETRHVSLCNSGSSANLLSVTALRDKYGLHPKKNVVLTSALAFPTTIAPLIQNGFVLKFIDVEPETLNPNIDTVLDCLQDKQVCGIAMAHTLGFPFDASLIKDALREDQWMLEDTADALGARISDRHVGTFGNFGTLSFFPAHHLATAEGGAVFTDDGKLYRLVEQYRSWGRACFPINTPITTIKGTKNIQDIIVSDWVLSHTGYFNVVENVFCRKYTGKIYKIKARNRPEIVVTEDHLFFVNENDKSSFSWIPAHKLQIGDYLIEKIPQWEGEESTFRWTYKTIKGTAKENELLFDDDLFRLIGYWLSQGSLARGLKGSSGYKENKYLSHRVDFCFHKDKSEIIDDLINQMTKFFGCSGSLRNHKNSKAVTISFKSRKAYEFFLQFCGVGAKNKHIPYDIMGYSPRNCMQLIWGLILGDGHKSFQGYSLTSISYEMIEQVRRILLLNGILTSCFKRDKLHHKESIVNGKVISQRHDLWTLSIYGVNAEKLAKLCGDNYVSRSKRQFSYIDKEAELATYKIYKIESEDVIDLNVYNLEVQNDHSYHAWGVAVHNCWCIPGVDNTCNKRFEWEFPKLPKGYDHKYTFTKIGYNLKMTDLQAALGVSQCNRLPYIIARRKENFEYLLDNLQQFEEHLLFPTWEIHITPSPFGFPITVVSDEFTRDSLVKFLNERKIYTRPIFSGNITRHPMMESINYIADDGLDGCNYIMERSFWIGCHPELTKAHLEYVVENFYKFMEKI